MMNDFIKNPTPNFAPVTTTKTPMTTTKEQVEAAVNVIRSYEYLVNTGQITPDSDESGNNVSVRKAKD
jgi:hypothetical protein